MGNRYLLVITGTESDLLGIEVVLQDLPIETPSELRPRISAMDKEWKKLTDKGCWLEDKVREFPDCATKSATAEA